PGALPAEPGPAVPPPPGPAPPGPAPPGPAPPGPGSSPTTASTTTSTCMMRRTASARFSAAVPRRKALTRPSVRNPSTRVLPFSPLTCACCEIRAQLGRRICCSASRIADQCPRTASASSPPPDAGPACGAAGVFCGPPEVPDGLSLPGRRLTALIARGLASTSERAPGGRRLLTPRRGRGLCSLSTWALGPRGLSGLIVALGRRTPGGTRGGCRLRRLALRTPALCGGRGVLRRGRRRAGGGGGAPAAACLPGRLGAP